MDRRQRHQSAVLGDLCQEAVEQFGSDWMGIREYVKSALDKLPKGERAKVYDDIRAILSFSPPRQSGRLH
jgi:hypothetical protein